MAAGKCLSNKYSQIVFDELKHFELVLNALKQSYC